LLVAGFLEGAVQALTPSHLLAIVALALALGPDAERFPVLPIAACAVGLGVASAGLAAALRAAETVPLFLLAVAGLLGGAVASRLHVPTTAQLVAAAATGGLIAFDAPPQAIRLPQAVAAQIGTATAVLVALALIVIVVRKATRPWQTVALRILGSWIAASAILVIALRLVR
jgi:hypothetical protein